MEKWLKLRNRINALSLRERVLVFLSGTAVLFLLWNSLMFTPQHREREALNGQMRSIQQKFDAQTQEVTVLTKLSLIGGDAERVQLLAKLERQNSALKDELSELVSGFAPASQLMNVLKDVLKQSNKLTIKRIESLPPEELNFSVPGKTGKTEVSGIFRHSVVLTLESRYVALFQYLQSLEELPWRFHWDSLKYTVSAYPLGDIELRVSTLTMEGALFEN